MPENTTPDAPGAIVWWLVSRWLDYVPRPHEVRSVHREHLTLADGQRVPKKAEGITWVASRADAYAIAIERHQRTLRRLAATTQRATERLERLQAQQAHTD